MSKSFAHHPGAAAANKALLCDGYVTDVRHRHNEVIIKVAALAKPASTTSKLLFTVVYINSGHQEDMNWEYFKKYQLPQSSRKKISQPQAASLATARKQNRATRLQILHPPCQPMLVEEASQWIETTTTKTFTDEDTQLNIISGNCDEGMEPPRYTTRARQTSRNGSPPPQFSAFTTTTQ